MSTFDSWTAEAFSLGDEETLGDDNTLLNSTEDYFDLDTLVIDEPSSENVATYLDDELTLWLKELNRGSSHYFETSMSKKTKKHVSSMEIFLKYVKYYPTGQVDCRCILSNECYEDWKSHHPYTQCPPSEAFRKCLIAHITRSDGRCVPFEHNIEQELLRCLRRKQVWPCFRGRFDSRSGKPITVGTKGVRCLGFQENLTLGKRNGSGNNSLMIPPICPDVKRMRYSNFTM